MDSPFKDFNLNISKIIANKGSTRSDDCQNNGSSGSVIATITCFTECGTCPTDLACPSDACSGYNCDPNDPDLSQRYCEPENR